MYTWNVPAGARTAYVIVKGAKGWSHSSNPGGEGGTTSGRLNLAGIDVLYIAVGGSGTASVGNNQLNGGGTNGGGNGRNNGGSRTVVGGGGGSSDVRLIRGSVASRIIVAGGGGGATGNSCAGGGCVGGNGGGLVGQDVSSTQDSTRFDLGNHCESRCRPKHDRLCVQVHTDGLRFARCALTDHLFTGPNSRSEWPGRSGRDPVLGWVLGRAILSRGSRFERDALERGRRRRMVWRWSLHGARWGRRGFLVRERNLGRRCGARPRRKQRRRVGPDHLFQGVRPSWSNLYSSYG